MRFILTKASDWNFDTKELINILNTTKEFETLKDGRKLPRWIIEIKDLEELMSFIKENGTIIVDKITFLDIPDSIENLSGSITIYDSYVE